MQLENVMLERGSHIDISAGVCAMEMVAFLAGEMHSDRPVCTCPVLAAFVRRLNDRFDDSDRQLLKPFIPRLIGTRDEKKRDVRMYFFVNWAAREFAPTVLEDSGRVEDAKLLRDLDPITDGDSARRARKVALEVRSHAADAAAYAAAAADAAAAAADAAAYAYAAAYAADAAKWRERADRYREMCLGALARAIEL
jgi:hypothetical protein